MSNTKMKTKEVRQVTGKERGSYALYFVGQNIFYILLLSFLNTYFLDIGITALAVSILVLVVKVWDAVNDPIFGGIVDRVKFKGGKFRPWLRISVVAIPIATVLLFAIPSSIPTSAKVIWAGIAYILWDTSYTICDVPIFGIVTTMTDNQNERTALMSIGRVAAMVAAIIVSLLVPQARQIIGGWFPMSIVLAVIGLLLMIPICVTAKERIKPVDPEKEVTFKEMGRFVIKNKYILIFYLAFFVSQSTNIATVLGIILARHIFGNEGMATVFTIVTLLPTIVMGSFMPRILRKIDKFYMYLFANIATVVMGVVIFLVGYQNFTLYLILLAIRGIPMGISIMLSFMFTPDCAEYGKYKTGIAAEGIAFSIQTFSVKLTAALASSLSAFVLFLIGFVATEGAIQPERFAKNFWFAYNIIPSIGNALALLIFSRYKLRDKYVQIMAKANSGEITREDAEIVLKEKF